MTATNKAKANESGASAKDSQGAPQEASGPPAPPPTLPDGPLPIRMLSDRLLVMPDAESGDRRSSGGILIPVTAEVGRRLAWAIVVAAGTHVRQVKVRDRVLFDPSDRAEVELAGQTYILLRERDVHGVHHEVGGTHESGLYL